MMLQSLSLPRGLSSEERESWCKHFFPPNAGPLDKGQLTEYLVDAVEQFQSRGMIYEAKWCMSLYARCKPSRYTEKDLALRLKLAHYGMEASLGNDASAAKALGNAKKMADTLGDENQKKLV